MAKWLHMVYWVTCSNCYHCATSYLEKCPKCGESMENGEPQHYMGQEEESKTD